MNTLTGIIANQEQRFEAIRKHLPSVGCFVGYFPQLIARPPIVFPDEVVDAYFAHVYTQCHFASECLPILVPHMAKIDDSLDIQKISTDPEWEERNYAMAHRCRILEVDLRRYVRDYLVLSQEVETFFDRKDAQVYLKHYPDFPIHYDEDLQMWKKCFIGYESLMWRADAISVALEKIILAAHEFGDKEIVIDATRLLEKIMPYRDLLRKLESETPGRSHGGYPIPTSTAIHLRLQSGFYGSRIFSDFSDDVPSLYPSLQSLQSVDHGSRDPSMPAVGGGIRRWQSHYHFALPLEGLVSAIQSAIDEDEGVRETTRLMEKGNWSIAQMHIQKAHVVPVIEKVLRTALPHAMAQRVVGFRYDFRYGNSHEVEAIECAPVIRESVIQFCDRSDVANARYPNICASITRAQISV